ncbi:Fungal transcription factor [Fusarium oxysporum f. sp. vasinfectum]|nr:Fungal transcription factor [Fusarium oxysporum f. sp. vasinfectum]KAK2924374.1 Fungal transcription factor [Fusarium oxysporum f. sp. vasinfectum]
MSGLRFRMNVYQVRFVHVEDPYAEQDSIRVDYPDETRETSYTPEAEQVSESPAPELDLWVDDSLVIEGEAYAPDTESSTPGEHPDQSRLATLHLLKHYKEGPGIWFDIFDTGCYFSGKVPVKAATSPLLKSSMCAIAAKHLYRVAKNQLNPKSNNSRWRGYDWRYESAKHYDEAIHHLKNAVDLCTYENSLSDREDMLAAVAILCIYELMDAPGTAWRAHLSALPLFNPTEDASHPASPVVIPRTAIQGPILWSLARQDLLCAFISETQTRLDLKDVRLWQNAGLATTEDGTLMPFSPPCSADIRTVADIEEDTKSNELTWLIGKLSNHLTSGDAINPSDYALPLGQRPTIGVTQERLLERWRMLLAEFKKWHDSLPSTFTPYARTPYPSSDSCFSNFTQIWYELPICAATMQNYHMAMILLLVNQPQESTFIRSTVSARLKSYRQIQQEVHHYAREICGVSLAEPSDPVRANSVQALFVAGQVFYEKGEQEAALKLLDDIETDLGWTTRFHRAKLVDEWPKDS